VGESEGVTCLKKSVVHGRERERKEEKKRERKKREMEKWDVGNSGVVWCREIGKVLKC